MTSATPANSVTSIAVSRGGASEWLRIASSVWIWLTGCRGSTSCTSAGIRRENVAGSPAVRASSVAFSGPVRANG